MGAILFLNGISIKKRHFSADTLTRQTNILFRRDWPAGMPFAVGRGLPQLLG
jgi:hypothetical protein